jgi:transposase-like protein
MSAALKRGESLSVFAPGNSELAAKQLMIFRRWPDGPPRCPSCKTSDPYKFRKNTGRLTFRCRKCKRDFSPTSGTVDAAHKKSFDEILNPLVATYASSSHAQLPKDGVARELVRLVDSIIPRALPAELRPDACQEMLLGILSREITVDDLRRFKVEMRERFIGRVKKTAGFQEFAISLDASFDGDPNSPSFYEVVKNYVHNPFTQELDEDDDIPPLEDWAPAEKYFRASIR